VAYEWHGRPGTKVVRTWMEPDERVRTTVPLAPMCKEL
jgi:hypothetical protein